VHLHLATADVTARIAMRRGAAIAPGASAIARLMLDKPIGALHGDRFILRDQSGARTLGGGSVLDPLPPARRVPAAARAAELAALEQPTAAAALAALARGPGRTVDLARFALLYNLLPEHAARIAAEAGLVALGKDSRVAVAAQRLAQLREALLAAVAAFHRAQPQAPGRDIESLRLELAPELPADAFGAVLRALADEGELEIAGPAARLPGHNATANAADDRLWQVLRPALLAAGLSPPPLKELAARLKLNEAAVRDLMHRKAKSDREVVKVGADRFYPRATLAALAATAQATAHAQPGGQFTAAQYRDATGIGRGLAIEVLECLDALGITQRLGDARKMRRDFAPILGEAAPCARPRAANAPPRPAPAGRGARR
jgi:selenocysteine-specific elongation factor